jgi:16S rRNA (cytidine1402-2'-O)-methyltransferase
VAGVLYVVATPIGNLSDLSPRAAEVLGQVGTVVAEDTRRSGTLLRGLQVRLE